MTKQKRDAGKKKQAMQKAKSLIDAGKFEEAKRILHTVEHPLADKWLQKLESKVSPKKTKTNSLKGLLRLIAIGVIAICGFLFLLVWFTPDENLSESTSISTAIPTSTPDADEMATQVDYKSSISQLRGIYHVAIADVRADDDGMLRVYLDIWAIPGHDITVMRNDIVEISSIWLGTDDFSTFTIHFDDGITSNTFVWASSGWETITGETIITPTMTPRPAPTQRPQSNVNTGGSRDTTIQMPENCDEAVEMGLTAQEAAQWDHLDRDNDGVACYGD